MIKWVNFNKIKKVFFFIFDLPKTVVFNFYYFSFFEACRLPVFVSRHVHLSILKGDVFLTDVRTGIVKIGYGDVGVFDKKNSRTIWRVSGAVHFKGSAHIGHGSKIGVTGKLILGNNFSITAESTIVSHELISIGKNVLISWDVLIMDTDFHYIYKENTPDIPVNPNMKVEIGDNVWLGCRSMVLKGVSISDGVVVGAGSVVSGKLDIKCSIYAGIPPKLLKESVLWKR